MKWRLLAGLLLFAVKGYSQSPDSINKLLDSVVAFNEYRIIGKQLAAFEVKSDKGITYTKDSLSHKVTFLNFWFENCVPCVIEFGALNELYERFKGDKDFRLLAFTFETPEVANRVKKKYQLKFELISVNRETCNLLNFTSGFPTNMLLDRTVTVNFFKVGGYIDRAYVSNYFATVIAPKVEALLEAK